MSESVYLVVAAAFVTAVATGLGAIPFAFVSRVGHWWLGLSNGLAAGLMLAATHRLFSEGLAIDSGRVLTGFVAGVLAVWAANAWVRTRGDVSVADLGGADARKALLIIGVMTAHSFAEGVGLGVAFAGGTELGWFITLAIGIQNVPEGLAIALVLVPRGTALWKAAGWSIVSSLPQPLMAAPAFAFVLTFEPLLPMGFGLAAGAMLWMVFAELLPDAVKNAPASSVGVAVTLAFAALVWLQSMLAA